MIQGGFYVRGTYRTTFSLGADAMIAFAECCVIRLALAIYGTPPRAERMKSLVQWRDA